LLGARLGQLPDGCDKRRLLRIENLRISPKRRCKKFSA
jgi:hypothetical protein